MEILERLQLGVELGIPIAAIQNVNKQPVSEFSLADCGH
jgi:hypothetical protein